MRLIHVARWAALAIACGSIVGTARGQLPQEIVSQYRPALEKLRQAYTHASFEGTSIVAIPRQDKWREQQFVLRAAGESRRLDVTTVKQWRMGLKVGSKELHLATPDGSLTTYMAPGSEFFDDAKQTGYAGTVAQIDKGSLLNYPYSLDGTTTILDMLLNPSVKVTSVKKTKSSGEPLVQIGFQETAQHAGRTGLWKSMMVLSPSDGWGLRSLTRTLGQGSDQVSQTIKVSYSGQQDGIPLVQTIAQETLNGTTPVRRESIEVTETKFGDPDNYYFTSFAF